MDKGDLSRVIHIIKYCDDIASLLKHFGESYNVFIEKKEFYYSISMCIMQIGELSLGLSDEFKEATNSQIPWRYFRNIRNRFAHMYSIMNENDIWEMATQDIPNFFHVCTKIIESTTPSA
jgi:uncharacterized protein with HEPN domain